MNWLWHKLAYLRLELSPEDIIWPWILYYARQIKDKASMILLYVWRGLVVSLCNCHRFKFVIRFCSSWCEIFIFTWIVTWKQIAFLFSASRCILYAEGAECYDTPSLHFSPNTKGFIECRNSTPHFASTPERWNENIKYMYI